MTARSRAYVPDPLAGREFTFAADVAADVSDAERAIAAFDAAPGALADTEALARLLLRAESVASSKIEGLEVGARRLLRADALRSNAEDRTATEVLGNIDAMAYALHAVRPGSPITVELLLETHRRLLDGTDIGVEHGGRVRTEQNWIGGSSYNPCSAIFVPPPPEFVGDLLDDLCAFCSDDALPPVAQAAIAHAQFENIHPFADGNGRVGRALIHMVLRARGLATRTTMPVSLVLATHAQSYLDALRATAYDGAPTSRAAISGVNQWVAVFSAACTEATAQAVDFEKTIRAMQERWLARLGKVRSDSVALRLVQALPGAPVLTLASAEALVGTSLRSVMTGMERLVEAGIVTIADDRRRRKRVFEAREIIDAFTQLERQLASPVPRVRV